MSTGKSGKYFCKKEKKLFWLIMFFALEIDFETEPFCDTNVSTCAHSMFLKELIPGYNQG